MVKASSFRGVTWSKRHSKWQAGISLQGRSVQHAPAELRSWHSSGLPRALRSALSLSPDLLLVLLRQLLRHLTLNNAVRQQAVAVMLICCCLFCCSCHQVPLPWHLQQRAGSSTGLGPRGNQEQRHQFSYKLPGWRLPQRRWQHRVPCQI
jgi:hypothetical protein